MNKVYLLIGGNIGDRSQNLLNAAKYVKQLAGTVLLSSSLYETEPWGITDQPKFLNQVLLIETILSPENLLEKLLLLEVKLGRERIQKFGPRIIDIDILFYNNLVINMPNLIIPHPEIQNRRFALEPLNEIAPSFIHPTLKKSIAQLLAKCSDSLKVQKIEKMESSSNDK